VASVNVMISVVIREVEETLEEEDLEEEETLEEEVTEAEVEALEEEAIFSNLINPAYLL